MICFALECFLCSVRSCSWIHGTVSRDLLYFVVVNHYMLNLSSLSVMLGSFSCESPYMKTLFAGFEVSSAGHQEIAPRRIQQ